MQDEAEPAEPGLICAECGAESAPGARGWRGYLTDDDEVEVFCPACAEREFGGGQAGLTA